MGGLGVRDVQSFNLALFAKQCWRILKDPSSLVSKLFKQKYYPNSNFLNAKLGHHPSFAWRSIVSGQSLLKVGLIWRIGNSHKNKSWKDKWIHGPLSKNIQSPISRLNEDAPVAILIDVANHWWKRDLINQILSPDEVKAITAIPLSIIGREYKQVWFPAKKWSFLSQKYLSLPTLYLH